MTPAYRVLADDNDITTAIRHRLLSLRVTDEAGYQSDAVEIQLDDRGNKIALLRKGVKLDIALGYEEIGLAAMGLFAVDEIELNGPPDAFTIRAKAADMRGSLKQHKTRSWDQTTIGSLVAAIAAEHGLEPRVGETLASVAIEHIDQTEESDLNLLTRLSKQYDAVAKPAGGSLLFVLRGEAKSAGGRDLRIAIHRNQTSGHRVTLADRGQYGAVAAHWQDLEAGEKVRTRAGEGEPVYTLRHPYPNAAEAQAAAQAKLRALNRGTGTLSLTLNPGMPALLAETNKPANPPLAAGTRLALSGFRPGVDGDWVLTRVTHEISSSGYSTQAEAETPNEKS